MPKCELLVTTKDGQEVAGIITLKHGRLSAQANKGYEILMKNVMEDPPTASAGGNPVFAGKNPEKWFHALPSTFDGTYLRARIMEEY